MSKEPRIGEARESVRGLTHDPITKLLLTNSQLTLAQLETLLAESISVENDVRKNSRRFYRPTRTRISRGAYNRTLIQAQNNVIRSIYTVLLLGYLGIFDSSSLQPFIELADTIESYAQQAKLSEDNSIGHLNSRLQEFITALARRHSFKDLL